MQITMLRGLEINGYIVTTIKGVSMRPLLYSHKSHVLIKRLEGAPCINDVVLYVRSDGTMVLHRVLGFDGDVCLIRGDNTFLIERVPMTDIRGVMTAFWRRNRKISVTNRTYLAYVRFWNAIFPLRLFKHKVRAYAVRGLKAVPGGEKFIRFMKKSRSVEYE